jgi:cytochrome P450
MSDTSATPVAEEAGGGLFDGLFASLNSGAGNPFELFSMLRKSAPVMQFPGGPGFWGVFRYEDSVRILRDHETFSSMVDAASMSG